jgi:hypothetical protein
MAGQKPFAELGIERQVLIARYENRALPRPEACSEALFHVMGRCWTRDPGLRPNIVDLRETVSQLFPRLPRNDTHHENSSVALFPVGAPNHLPPNGGQAVDAIQSSVTPKFKQVPTSTVSTMTVCPLSSHIHSSYPRTLHQVWLVTISCESPSRRIWTRMFVLGWISPAVRLRLSAPKFSPR